jgi:hypothetical protein
MLKTCSLLKHELNKIVSQDCTGIVFLAAFNFHHEIYLLRTILLFD